jgi:type I restriction enzyme S subunit
MVDSKQVPKMRFSGFDGSWIKRNLGFDVADIVGGGTPSTQNPEYWNGDIDWYSPTEIGNAVYACDSVKKITDLGLKHSSAQLLPANKTILFTSRAGIGYMAILQHPGATNQGFQSLILKEGYDTYFVYSMGFLIKKFAEKYSSGSTFLEISGKKLGMMEASIPSEQEQTKIGELFKNLDTLINQHQTRVAQLANVKKSMLDKMFPKAGADVPEVRFEGETKNWTYYKLGSIGMSTSGTSIESEFIEQGSYKVISIGSYSEDSTYTDQNIRVNLTKKTQNRILNENDLTMILNDKTASGNIIGRVLLIDQNNTYVYNQRTQRIEPFMENFAPIYLYQMLNAPNIRNNIIKKSQGNTQIYVNWSTIKSIKYPVPEIEEQTKIGQFFKNLDTLIAQNQKALDQLKNLKQALLHKMFV